LGPPGVFNGLKGMYHMFSSIIAVERGCLSLYGWFLGSYEGARPVGCFLLLLKTRLCTTCLGKTGLKAQFGDEASGRLG